jgi:hypothetical protein
VLTLTQIVARWSLVAFLVVIATFWILPKNLSDPTVSYGFFRSLAAWTLLAASTCCVLAGLFLLWGWTDPTGGEEAGRKAGWLIWMIRYWPFFLLGIGSYQAYRASRAIWWRPRNHGGTR